MRKEVGGEAAPGAAQGSSRACLFSSANWPQPASPFKEKLPPHKAPNLCLGTCIGVGRHMDGAVHDEDQRQEVLLDEEKRQDGGKTRDGLKQRRLKESSQQPEQVEDFDEVGDLPALRTKEDGVGEESEAEASEVAMMRRHSSSSYSSAYRSRTGQHLSSSRLQSLSAFWIKAVYVLSIVSSVVLCLPLLRLAFSGLGTSYLAVVFFVQGWALIGMVMYPFVHTFYGEKSNVHLAIAYTILGSLTAVSNAFTALTAYRDPLAGQPTTAAYTASNAIYYELYILTVLYMVFIYRQSLTVKSWSMYTATLPIYIYTLGAVQLLRFSQGRIDLWSYTFLVPFSLVVTYWIDRRRAKQGLITNDRGYMMLVVLFSNGATVSIGGFMLTWLMKVAPMADIWTLVVSVAWSFTGFTFWLMWRASAMAASDKELFAPLMFALQLTLSLYSELIFMSISLRSPVWWLLLLYDMAIVVLRDSGFALHVYREGKLRFRLWQAERRLLKEQQNRQGDDDGDELVQDEEGDGKAEDAGDGKVVVMVTSPRDVSLSISPEHEAEEAGVAMTIMKGKEESSSTTISTAATTPLSASQTIAKLSSQQRERQQTVVLKPSPTNSTARRLLLQRLQSFSGVELRRVDSEFHVTATSAVLSLALGKNQALLDMVGNEESEETSLVIESQGEVTELGTTICVLILFPLEYLLGVFKQGGPSLSLGYSRRETQDITVGYVVIFVAFFVGRWACARLSRWLQKGLRSEEEMAAEEEAAERLEKEHWVSHMPYFVAVTVFVVMDCIFRLIELRLTITSGKVVRAF